MNYQIDIEEHIQFMNFKYMINEVIKKSNNHLTDLEKEIKNDIMNKLKKMDLNSIYYEYYLNWKKNIKFMEYNMKRLMTTNNYDLTKQQLQLKNNIFEVIMKKTLINTEVVSHSLENELSNFKF